MQLALASLPHGSPQFEGRWHSTNACTWRFTHSASLGGGGSTRGDLRQTIPAGGQALAGGHPALKFRLDESKLSYSSMDQVRRMLLAKDAALALDMLTFPFH